MPLSAAELEMVAGELKKFSEDLKLSDLQKQRLYDFLSDAAERLEDFKKRNPSASAIELAKIVSDNRTGIRRRMAFFLSPEQLAKWDGEAAKVTEFLGLKTVA